MCSKVHNVSVVMDLNTADKQKFNMLNGLEFPRRRKPNDSVVWMIVLLVLGRQKSNHLAENIDGFKKSSNRNILKNNYE